MTNFSVSHEVEQLLNNSITVEELIELLQGYNPDAKVVLSSDYGDISHTKQAMPVWCVQHLCEEMESLLNESGYSHSRVAIEEGDVYDEDGEFLDERFHDVVVLS